MGTLTEKDCYSVMEARLKDGTFEVSSFSLQPFSQVLGFHGIHALLKINVLLDKTVKEKEFVFFVKMVTKDQTILQKYFYPMKFFFKEHILLTKVLKDLQMYSDKKLTAECYLSRLNRFVVLENLTEAGYEIARVSKMDLNHAKVALQTFAQFHSATFIFEEKGELISEKYEEIIYENIFQTFKDRDYLLLSCHKGITVICDKFFTKYSKNIRDKILTKAKERVKLLSKPSKKYRNVLCQGDPWGNNVLYKYAGALPEEGILIDFQTSRYAPPALELMQFLYIATTTDFRKEYSETLQDYYYNTLAQILSKKNFDLTTSLPRESFNESCQLYKEFGLCARLYYNYVTKIPGGYLKEMAESSQKFLDFMIHGDPGPALSSWTDDDDYRTQLTEAIEDTFQFYLTQKSI